MTEPTQDKIFPSRLVVNAPLQSFQKERSLRFRFCQLKRSTELFCGGLQIARPHFEFAEHRVEQIVRIQFIEISNLSHSLESGFWPMDVGDGHGTIESHDRRLIEFNEPIVKRKDLRPIGRFVVLLLRSDKRRSLPEDDIR